MGVEGAPSLVAIMLTSEPDPLIHDPERLRIVATLAAPPDGDALSVTRLQDLIRLPPGSLAAVCQGLLVLDCGE
jgi:hypothetical protein